MKNLKYYLIPLFLIVISLFILTGCGDDTTNNNNNNNNGTPGWHPNLNFSVGQQFVYTNDSLHATAGHNFTRRRTNSSIAAQVFYQNQQCYMVTGSTFDSTNNQTTPEIPYYIRYDQNSGKYYQYGIRQLINITQPGSWDTVGNFDVSRGTSYFIGNVDYTVPVPGLGTVHFTGPLNGKIADSTTIQQYSNGASIPCYHIELTATISGSIGTSSVNANVIFDYYLGYASPTGVVEVKLRPFSFTVAGIPNVAPQPGYDRKLYSHNP